MKVARWEARRVADIRMQLAEVVGAEHVLAAAGDPNGAASII